MQSNLTLGVYVFAIWVKLNTRVSVEAHAFWRIESSTDQV